MAEEKALRKSRRETEADDVENPVFDSMDGASSPSGPPKNRRYREFLMAKEALTDVELRELLYLLATSELLARAEQDTNAEYLEEEHKHAVNQLPDRMPLIDFVYGLECSEFGQASKHLRRMTVFELKERAAEQGVTKDEIHSCFDHEDARAALVDMILSTMDAPPEEDELIDTYDRNGSLLDLSSKLENMLEQKTGMDLDGDGDVGVLGNASPGPDAGDDA